MEYLKQEFDAYAAECECALRIVLASIENLSQEMDIVCERNPFSAVASRLKKFESAIEKCERKYGAATRPNLRRLHDVAGVRIITHFEDDIYAIRDALMSVPAFKVVEESDYVTHPKANGYRSLHLIVNVHIYLMGIARVVPVEIQIRDKAMDLWASIEHVVNYKHPNPSPETIEQFKYIADILQRFDERAMRLRDEATFEERESKGK